MSHGSDYILIVSETINLFLYDILGNTQWHAGFLDMFLFSFIIG